MSLMSRVFRGAAAAALITTGVASAADIYGLTEGNPNLQSAGPLAIGPDGILFIGDTKAASVVAIQTGDKAAADKPADRTVDGVGAELAKLFGVDAGSLTINDLAVNPKSGNIYLSVAAGGKPGIAKIDGSGKASLVSLDKIPFSKSELSNPPADGEVGDGRRRSNPRNDSITDLAFVEGQVIVSGLSKEGSAVRSFLFPFGQKDQEVNLEIYHGAHGRVESMAPIRTFVPFVIDGQPHVLAGFVCTPLVRFPVKAVGSNEKVKGTTVAELGNRNRPLDMIAYKKDGKDYLLLTNSARGVMKVSTDDLDREVGITEQVRDGGVAGQKYETVADLKGVVQLDKVNDSTAVVLLQAEQNGPITLKTIALP